MKRSKIVRWNMGALLRLLVASFLVVAMTTGCDSEGYLDHTPPAGQGSLIVDNHTADDIDIFLDGQQVERVGDDSERTLDLDPGIYRLVLSGEDGNGAYATDVDILQGRLTVVEVWSYSSYEYDVTIRYVEP